MAHLPLQNILCLESVHAEHLSAGAAEEGPLRASCVRLRARTLSPLWGRARWEGESQGDLTDVLPSGARCRGLQGI